MSRPRGFASWRPQRKTLDLLGQVDAVLDEYAAYLPLTLRQLFYRLVGAHGYPKIEQAYDRLCETLNRARRAELVPFDAIRDDGITSLEPYAFTGKPDFWSAVRATTHRYRLDRLIGQDQTVEVWVEAAGMAPQIAAAVDEYGIAVYSTGGFDSLTAKHEAAERIAARDRPTVVLHVGDFDPSGLALFTAAQEASARSWTTSTARNRPGSGWRSRLLRSPSTSFPARRRRRPTGAACGGTATRRCRRRRCRRTCSPPKSGRP